MGVVPSVMSTEVAPTRSTAAKRLRSLFIVLLGTVCVFGVSVLLWYRYHPFRMSFNADDTMIVLQSAYHSLPRDGVRLWAVDRIGAFYLVFAHFVLETLGLRASLPHAWYLLWQQIILLLIATACLGQRMRTAVIGSILVAILLSLLNTPKPQIVRVGNAYPQMMFTAMLALVLLLRCEQYGGLLNWLWFTIAALAALVSSPPTVLLLAVWMGMLLAFHWHDLRRSWPRLTACVVSIGAAHLLAPVVRTLCDHGVYANRAVTPMGLSWSAWLPTMIRFAKESTRQGVVPSIVMGSGVVMGFAIIPWAVRHVFFVRDWAKRTPMRSAAMLAGSGCAYLAVSAASTWVHLNPVNPQYRIPSFILFLAAFVSFLSTILARLPRALVVALGSTLFVALATLCIVRAPNKPSASFRRAEEMIKLGPALGGSVALLGTFWIACEGSYIDPHRVIGSDFAGGFIAHTMLPEVLSHDRVLISAEKLDGPPARNGRLPDVFWQHGYLLVREPTCPLRLPPGWQCYRSCHITRLITGENLLNNDPTTVNGHVRFGDKLLKIAAASGRASEVFWPLGALPSGMYIASLAARATSRGGARDAVTSFYLLDRTIESEYPHVQFSYGELGPRFAYFGQVFSYSNVGVETLARLYTWSTVPIDISELQVCSFALPPVTEQSRTNVLPSALSSSSARKQVQ